MPLSDTAIRKAKPRERQRKMFDTGGLYLLITPKGQKWWRLRYRFAGREQLLSLGVYPDVGLADAREGRDAARKLVAAGKNPSAHRTQEKLKRQASHENTFKAVAKEWLAKQEAKWTDVTLTKATALLETTIYPWIGARPIADIEPPEVLSALRRIEARGKHETAHRARQRCSQIFRYAVSSGRALRDPTTDLRGALTPAVTEHHASVKTPEEVGALIRSIQGYRGHFVTACALKLAPLLFVRPGELRRMEWSELDLDAAEWRIPDTKMKSRRQHLVPLSEQALAILRELQPLTGRAQYVFPSIRSASRPMSENTITGALRRLGYAGDEMTGHGFRSMASTLLNEQGYPSDVIERQLAHGERNKVRAAYNFAQHLPQRRTMMQGWADYLDRLAKANSKVTTLRPAA